jgi:hypothetical protein
MKWNALILAAAIAVATPGLAVAQTVAGAQSASGAVAAVETAAGAYNEGNHITFEGTRIPRQTPEAYAPMVVPGGNLVCLGGVSGGVATPAFAITGGGSRLDDGCDTIRLVEMLLRLGERDVAIRVLCENMNKAASAFRSIGRDACVDRAPETAPGSTRRTLRYAQENPEEYAAFERSFQELLRSAHPPAPQQ